MSQEPRAQGPAHELRRLAGDTLVYGASSIAGRIAGVLLVPLYTRAFTPDVYGAVEIATTVSEVATIVLILGLDYSSGYLFYRTDDPAERSRVIGTALLLQLMASLGLCVLGLCVLRGVSALLFVDRDDRLTLTLLLLASLPVAVVSKNVQTTLRFLRRPWPFSILAIGKAFLTVALGIGFVVVRNYGARGAIAAALVASVAGNLGGIVWIRRHFKLKVEGRLVRPLLRLGLPLVLGNVAWWALTLSNRFFLREYADMRAVGIYAVSAKVAMLPGFVLNAVQMSWMPFALSIQRRNDARRVIGVAMSCVVAGVCSSAVAVSLFSHEIVRFGTSAQYVESASYAPLLIGGNLALGLYALWSTGSTLGGRPGALTISVILGAVVNLSLNVMLIPRWSMLGAGIASIAGGMAMAIYVLVSSQRHWRIPMEGLRVATIIAGAALAMALGALTTQSPMSRAIVGLLFFGAVGVILRPARLRAALNARDPDEPQASATT